MSRTPGGERPTTAFGDPASSRVLLVGDPHPENIGTFRAADGTILVEWNDFDAAGYGPYEADVRRLATAMVVAAGDDTLDLLARGRRRVRGADRGARRAARSQHRSATASTRCSTS